MAEFSMMPWETQTGTGDGQFSYTQDQASQFFRDFHIANVTTAGVISGIDNELEVSGSVSPLAVATGKAYSYARYWSDAIVNLVVSTPAIGDTGFRVVLRSTWATNQTRLAVLRSADGNNAIPALTQVVGTTWEISLASGVIDLAGNIWRTSAKTEAGVTDTRQFAISPTAGMVKLRTYRGNGTDTCRFRDIQQDLSHIRIAGTLLNQAGSLTATNALLRLNNDSGANYAWNQQRFNQTGGTVLVTSAAQTEINVGVCTSSSAGANLRDIFVIDIPLYREAGNKAITMSLGRYGNGTTTMFSYRTDGYWLNTAAVNEISLFANDGGSRNWATGTIITLYGMR